MNHSNEFTSTPSSSSRIITLDVPMSIRSMTLVQQSYRYGIVVFGTLINFIVVVLIRNSRQLHYPRHVFWAAISLMNHFCIIHLILELVAITNDNRVACQIFVLNAGVLYTIILTFLALAALDRYLAIARYEWYKNNVTNRGVIYLLSFGGFLTYVTITSPFWMGFRNISDCTVNLTHMHCVMIYDVILGVLCVLLHAMIFILSRVTINKHPSNFLQTSIALQFLPTHFKNPTQETQRTGGNLQEDNETLGRIARAGPQPRTADTLCFSWFYNRPKLNRLEILAAMNMSVNVLPVWLCTFPVTLNAIAIYWCIRLEEKCPFTFRINSYFADLFHVHIIYNPLMYMLTSTEFKRALVHLLKQKWKL